MPTITSTAELPAEVSSLSGSCFGVPVMALGIELAMWDTFLVLHLLEDQFADMWNVQQSLSLFGLEDSFEVVGDLQGEQLVDSFVILPEQLQYLIGPGAPDIQLPFASVTKEL
jgi:hypothetical protein